MRKKQNLETDSLFIILFQFDVDQFVASHLNDHRKGLLGRQMSAEALLTFSKAILLTVVYFIILNICP